MVKLTPVERSFEIEYEGEKINVSFRQATVGDAQKLAAHYSKRQQALEGDRIVIFSEFNPEEDAMLRVYYTLSDCDMCDENGNQVFRFKEAKYGKQLDMTLKQFQEMWGILPIDLAAEMYKCCLEANPQWGELA